MLCDARESLAQICLVFSFSVSFDTYLLKSKRCIFIIILCLISSVVFGCVAQVFDGLKNVNLV